MGVFEFIWMSKPEVTNYVYLLKGQNLNHIFV